MFDSNSGDITNMKDSDFDFDEIISCREREILDTFQKLIWQLDWQPCFKREQKHPISLKLAILADEIRRGRT